MRRCGDSDGAKSECGTLVRVRRAELSSSRRRELDLSFPGSICARRSSIDSVAQQWIVDVHFDGIEGNDGLDCAVGAPFVEFEDAEDFQVLQVAVDVGDVAVDEASGFTHALGAFGCDGADEFESEWSEAVDEVVVGAELEDCTVVGIVEIGRLGVLDELEGILTELFSVADGDVERGHVLGVVSRVGVACRQSHASIRQRWPKTS